MKPSLPIVMLVPTLVAVWGSSASAEEGKPTTSGPRVRVTALGFAAKPIVGVLTAIDATKITILRSKESAAVAIPRDALTRFEISHKSSRKGKGAGIGALIGAGVGAALGVAAGADCGAPDASFCISRGASAAAVGLAGAAVGSILGAIIAPGEKWETANLDSLKVSVTLVGGRRGGVGLMLSLRF